jgi:quinol monooxygenase YgiN
MIGAPQLIRDTTLLTDALRNHHKKRSLPVGLVASGLELETAIIKVAEGNVSPTALESGCALASKNSSGFQISGVPLFPRRKGESIFASVPHALANDAAEWHCTPGKDAALPRAACSVSASYSAKVHLEAPMDKFALLALLQAKPGKEQEVEAFLKSAQPLAVRENGTTTWYAVKLGPAKFGIFDTFKNEDGRDAHLTGEIAKALFAKAEDLFAVPPQVEKLQILASKAPDA